MPVPIGLTYCFRESRLKPVVLKSHAIKVYMERDEMTYEEAEEFWDYNVAGTDLILIAVDDTVTPNELSETLCEQDEEDGLKEDLNDPLEWNDSAKAAAKIQGIDLNQ